MIQTFVFPGPESTFLIILQNNLELHLSVTIWRLLYTPLRYFYGLFIGMDGDPATDPELDAFSLILPLPYRIAAIIVLGTLPSCLSR